MSKEIATTILNQLGGKRFIVMTGAKDFVAHEDGLSFKIGRNSSSANYVKIKLTPSDTYDMIFERVTISKKTMDIKRKEIDVHEGIYFDMLTSFFTDTTGLYTNL